MFSAIGVIILFVVVYVLQYLARRYISKSTLDVILKILIVLFILFGIYLYYIFSLYEEQRTALQNQTSVVKKS